MTSFNQKLYIKGAKGRIQKRITDITQQSQNLVTYLNGAVFQFQQRAKVLTDTKEQDFFKVYHQLKQDLEAYEEKLYFIQSAQLNSSEVDEPDSFYDCKTEDASQNNSQQHHPILSCSTNLNQSISEIFSQKSSNGNSQSGDDQVESPQSLKYLKISQCSENSNESIHLIDNSQLIPQSSNYSNENTQLSKNLVECTSISNHSIKDNHEPKKLSLERIKSIESHQQTSATSSNISEDLFIKLSSQSQQSDSQSSLYQSISSFSTDVVLNDNSSTNANTGTELTNVQENRANLIAREKTESSCNFASETAVKEVFRTLLPYEVSVPSEISAVVTDVTDPGNFWMHLQDPHFSKICTYALCTFDDVSSPQFMEGDFCLAPFKDKALYRAVIQSTSNTGGGACAYEEETAQIFFVDHGYTQETPVKLLKPLPKKAYSIPTMAIHCYLAEAYPIGDVWSNSSTKRFEEILHKYNIHPSVLCKDGNKYGVKLVAAMPTIEEMFSCDVATMLHFDGLALEAKKCRKSDNLAASDNCNVSSGLNQTYRKELEPNTSFSNVENRISCDSGVSVTSFQDLNSPQKERNISSDSISDFFTGAVAMTQDSLDACGVDGHANCESLDALSEDCSSNQSAHTQIETFLPHSNDPLRKFDSFNRITVAANDVVDELKHMDIYPSSDLSMIKGKGFNDASWNVIVPPPSVIFIEKNMMLVLMSHIVDPGEFYINLAQENCSSLDDLQEQMSDTYESMQNVSSLKGRAELLRENMYCSAPYELDANWYRVKILHIDKDQVEVQFIDFGNKALVAIDKLHPLTPELAKFPAFAVKCSLALVVPNSEEIDQTNGQNGFRSEAFSPGKWNDHSINTFKKLTGYDKCLTAQVLDKVDLNKRDSLPVLLWDNQESQDLCINECLIVEHAAALPPELYELDKDTASNNVSVFNTWNPMEDHYNNPENSYGVDANDLEIATVGFKANDERYACKYFIRNGRCPRGDNCEYRHVFLDSDGITIDQVETFSFDYVPPLPEVATYVLLEISAVINPGHFYVVFPFGLKAVDEIDDMIRNGKSMKNIVNLEPKVLSAAMCKHYNKAVFRENTAIARAIGDIVVAKSSYDDLWHRARVIGVQEIASPVEVFFVDRGYRETVPRINIRDILPEFTHMPFQAVECFLSDVEPKNRETGVFWTTQSRDYFLKLVESQILLSYVVHKDASTLYLTLKNTTQSDHQSISELLVAKEYAQYASYENSVHYLQKSTNQVYLPG